MKHLYPLFILILVSFKLHAQQDIIRCYTMEMDSILRANFPELGTHAQFEKWLEEKINQKPPHSDAIREVYTIPVIVHVIHNGENIGSGNNISQAQVISQFDVLNEDFRRLPGTPGFNNHPDGADVEIEFCPAFVDPNGEPLTEPGINRIDRNSMGFNSFPYTPNYIENTVKPNTFWDPELYFNIWVVPISGGILGYAQFPSNSGLMGMPANGGPAATDGIVTRTTAFGRVGNVQAPFHLGRTTTHEVGHWLGLRHIWGDGGCSVDDFCGDTPQSDSPNFGCNVGHVSCSSQDMVENYMDYSDDACMNIFTQCQRTRMRIVMNNSPRRLELLNSTVCNPPQAPVANFEASTTQSCPDVEITFTDLSTYFPNSWSWEFPGGTPSTSNSQNPVVTYDQPGNYDVTLTVSNNSGTDVLTLNNYIEITTGISVDIFKETFETNSTTLSDWLLFNPNNGITWALYTIGGTSPGSRAIGVNFFNYNDVGEIDRLISPLLDFTGFEDLELTFEHAYTRYPGFPSDTLRIYISTDGNTTPNDLIAVLAEDGTGNFATVPDQTSGFFPSSQTDWCSGSVHNLSGCFVFDLSAYDEWENIRIIFESETSWGNNLFLDNITVRGICTDDDCDPVAFRSASSGNWSDDLIWLSSCDEVNFEYTGLIPVSDQEITVTISSGHQVVLNMPYNAENLNQIIIEEDAVMSLEAAESNFAFSQLEIFGRFIMNHPVYLPSGSIEVMSSGIYEHAVDASALPAVTWNPGSEFLLSGITGNLNALSGIGQNFSNFTFESNLDNNHSFNLNEALTVQNVFTVAETGGGRLVQQMDEFVTGSIVIENGIFEIEDQQVPRRFFVMENFTVENGTFIPNNSEVEFFTENPAVLSVNNNPPLNFHLLTVNKSENSTLSVESDVIVGDLLRVINGRLNITNSAEVETDAFRIENNTSELIIETDSKLEVRP